MNIQSFAYSLIFSVLFISSCTNIKKLNERVSTKKHSPTSLIKDVDYVHRVLEKGHPGIYWYISKENLDYKFDSVKKTINKPLTSREFYQKLAPLVAEIKCGHTRLLLVNKKLNKKERDSLSKLNKPINQLNYKVISDKVYISSVDKKVDNLKKGSEILSINGVETGEMLKSIYRNFASDGYNQTFKPAALNRAFSSWYTSIYPNSDTINLKLNYRDSTFNYQLVTYKKDPSKPAVKKNPIKLSADSLLAKKKIEKEKLKQRYRGLDEQKKPILDLQFKGADSSIAYLKVKSFSFPYANFDRFFKESFESIRKHHAKDLIIDLRDNGGGSLQACRTLFSYLVDKKYVYLQNSYVERRFNPNLYSKKLASYLKIIPFELASRIWLRQTEKDDYQVKYEGMKPLDPKKNHFDGNVYVLINGYSFSASALLSANLKQINRAIFVGQETGGAYNGCVAGNIPTLDLPNSALKLRMGLFPVLPNAHTDRFGRGIFPDQEINTTIEDVIAGKDREMEWVFQDIKKKNQKVD